MRNAVSPSRLPVPSLRMYLRLFSHDLLGKPHSGIYTLQPSRVNCIAGSPPTACTVPCHPSDSTTRTPCPPLTHQSTSTHRSSQCLCPMTAAIPPAPANAGNVTRVRRMLHLLPWPLSTLTSPPERDPLRLPRSLPMCVCAFDSSRAFGSRIERTGQASRVNCAHSQHMHVCAFLCTARQCWAPF